MGHEASFCGPPRHKGRQLVFTMGHKFESCLARFLNVRGVYWIPRAGGLFYFLISLDMIRVGSGGGGGGLFRYAIYIPVLLIYHNFTFDSILMIFYLKQNI